MLDFAPDAGTCWNLCTAKMLKSLTPTRNWIMFKLSQCWDDIPGVSTSSECQCMFRSRFASSTPPHAFWKLSCNPSSNCNPNPIYRVLKSTSTPTPLRFSEDLAPKLQVYCIGLHDCTLETECSHTHTRKIVMAWCSFQSWMKMAKLCLKQKLFAFWE